MPEVARDESITALQRTLSASMARAWLIKVLVTSYEDDAARGSAAGSSGSTDVGVSAPPAQVASSVSDAESEVIQEAVLSDVFLG